MFSKSKNAFIFIIALLLSAVPLLNTPASAADTVDYDRLGSITITLKEFGSHTVVPGAELTLYQVADAKGIKQQLSFVFNDDFKDCGMTLDDLHAEGLAQHLAVYAAELEYQNALQELGMEE